MICYQICRIELCNSIHRSQSPRFLTNWTFCKITVVMHARRNYQYLQLWFQLLLRVMALLLPLLRPLHSGVIICRYRLRVLYDDNGLMSGSLDETVKYLEFNSDCRRTGFPRDPELFRAQCSFFTLFINEVDRENFSLPFVPLCSSLMVNGWLPAPMITTYEYGISKVVSVS